MSKKIFAMHSPSWIQPAPPTGISLKFRPQMAPLKNAFLRSWMCIMVWMILGTGIGWCASDPPKIPQQAGESATLLPNGAFLLLGGEEEGKIRATARIWQPQTQEMNPLSSTLQVARAWHSATMLPDGTILIVGGVGATGQVVTDVERYDPDTETFKILADSSLTPRAFHTATLLTEGRVLIAGGRSDTQETLDRMEIWDPHTSTAEIVALGLSLPRSHHAAALQPDGRGLLLGGMDQLGVEHSLQDVFDPDHRAFTLTQEDPDSLTLPILVETSFPADGAKDVLIDQRIAVRLSRPVRIDTIMSDTIRLEDAAGRLPLKIVPTEEGQLLFLTPLTKLQPQNAYALRLDGLQDSDGNWLAPTTIIFRTGSDEETPPAKGSGQNNTQTAAAAGGTAAGRPNSPTTPDPRAAARAARYSPWRDLPPLQAPRGVTALSGQVFTRTDNHWPRSCFRYDPRKIPRSSPPPQMGLAAFS